MVKKGGWVQDRSFLCRMAMNPLTVLMYTGRRQTIQTHKMIQDKINKYRFDIAGFSGVLSMIYAIEMINNSSLLGDIRLGYEIHDTCAEVTTAVRATMNFIAKSNSSTECLEPECTNSEYIPKVKAVVGASYSENSMAVARVLNLLLMPQVSYSSSAEILSDKLRFPAFLRTVPKDSYQTRAIAKLVKRSGWNWIGTIATDDDYGRAAIDSFISQATELNICIAFKQIIPAYLSDKTIDKQINETIKTLYKETKVKVIVVFAKPKHMIKLFSSLDKAAMSKIWIASDSWSTSSEVANFPGIKDVKNIIGFMFKGGNLTSFSNFLKNLPTNEEYLNKNVFLKEFKDLLSSCLANSTNSSNCLLNFKVGASEDERDILMKNFRPGIAYRTQLAVVAIANGIRDFYTTEEYQNSTDFPPWKLLESVKNVTFTYEGQNISFDSHGDTNLGYQIVMWKTRNETLNLQNVVAEYDIENDAFIFNSNETEEQIDSLKRAWKPNPVGARGHRQAAPRCLNNPGPQHFRHTRNCWGGEGEEGQGHLKGFRVRNRHFRHTGVCPQEIAWKQLEPIRVPI
ncbi:GPC6A protein, partial [Polypterus senegalus]